MNREPGPLRHGNPRGNPNLAPRCGARNRAGCPCRAPALRGHTRCRLHGGHSTGPRTPVGLARLRAARTVHGLYGAENRARFHRSSLLMRQSRLLCDAARLQSWLPAPMAARLLAGAADLLTPPPAAWDGRTPCTVSRRVERAAVRAELARLAPWQAAIAAAKAARRTERAGAENPGQDLMNREAGAGAVGAVAGGGKDPLHLSAGAAGSRGWPACAGHDGEGSAGGENSRAADASAPRQNPVSHENGSASGGGTGISREDPKTLSGEEAERRGCQTRARDDVAEPRQNPTNREAGRAAGGAGSVGQVSARWKRELRGGSGLTAPASALGPDSAWRVLAVEAAGWTPVVWR